MKTHLDLARERLLAPTGIDDQILDNTLELMLSHNNDYADLFFQASNTESWSIEDGIIKDAGASFDHGVGVRAVNGDKSGFAYSDDLEVEALQDAALAARSISQVGGKQRIGKRQDSAGLRERLYIADNPIYSLTSSEKIEILRAIDARARAINPKVQRVIASLSAAYNIVLIAASDGTLAADCRPMVRLNVNVIAEHKGVIESATSGAGGRVDYKFFSQDKIEDLTQEAVRLALINLEAEPAPAGNMPVVLGHGWPGVLLHEAVGHGLEGDFNRKKTSAFSGRIGEQVASELCTVVDDGTMANRRGSLNVDDEGTPSQYNVLIENGVLKKYMQDKLNAKLMGTTSTGNARRESYAYLPMPRMTNTYMLPGPHSPEQIIASVKHGIYAENFGGGQVDITSGKFVFNSSLAYLIKDGKVMQPIKGVTLSGNGPEVMQKISMLGNDLKLDPGIGVCGKEGQSVPVGVGQPTLLVDDLTVGGTKI